MIIYVYVIDYTSMEQQDQLSTIILSGICDLSSSKMVSGHAIDKVGRSFGVLPSRSTKKHSMPVVSPTLYEGTS